MITSSPGLTPTASKASNNAPVPEATPTASPAPTQAAGLFKFRHFVAEDKASAVYNPLHGLINFRFDAGILSFQINERYLNDGSSFGFRRRRGIPKPVDRFAGSNDTRRPLMNLGETRVRKRITRAPL